jgi:hypothetical protein
MRSLVTLFFGGLLVALGGCGSPSAPACSATFTPCGGDLAGTWSIDTVCNLSDLETSCAGSTVHITQDWSGTYTFNSDGTISAIVKPDVTETLTLPPACFSGVTSCSALGSPSNTSNGLTSQETCTGDVSQSCTCTSSLSGTESVTGTYSTMGNDVTTAIDGAAGAATPYCVSGSQLQVQFDNSPSSSNVYILFTRQ